MTSTHAKEPLARKEKSTVPARDLFVSVVQAPQVLASRDEMLRLIDFAKRARIKILFVQIYRANQAWFPSTIADTAPYEKCRKNVGEDAFQFLIKQAHREGLQVHAWLNLLSLAENAKAPFLKKYGPGVLTQNLKPKQKLVDYKIDNQYFLEPGDPRVRRDLAKIVQEILTAYPDLDGIQFDYIRYPDADPHYGYTALNIERFKKATGRETIDEDSPVWHTWRRDQVTESLAGLVKKARAFRPGIQVSATGCMPYGRAYFEAYQDWPSWVNQGLVDFVTVMNYSPDPEEFRKWIVRAKKEIKDFSKVKIGVGAYKLVKDPAVFTEEFRDCEKTDAGACVVFHYGSLIEGPRLKTFLIQGQGRGLVSVHHKERKP